MQNWDWPLFISVVGTIASALGFAFTVCQLRRTAQATTHAASAIGKLKNRMATHDLIAECLVAVKALQHAARSLSARQYSDASNSILDAQVSVNRISVSLRAPDSLKRDSKEMSEVLIEAVAEIDDLSEKDVDYDTRGLTIRLRKFASKLDAQVSSTNQEVLP